MQVLERESSCADIGIGRHRTEKPERISLSPHPPSARCQMRGFTLTTPPALPGPTWRSRTAHSTALERPAPVSPTAQNMQRASPFRSSPSRLPPSRCSACHISDLYPSTRCSFVVPRCRVLRVLCGRSALAVKIEEKFDRIVEHWPNARCARGSSKPLAIAAAADRSPQPERWHAGRSDGVDHLFSRTRVVATKPLLPHWRCGAVPCTWEGFGDMHGMGGSATPRHATDLHALPTPRCPPPGGRCRGRLSGRGGGRMCRVRSRGGARTADSGCGKRSRWHVCATGT